MGIICDDLTIYIDVRVKDSCKIVYQNNRIGRQESDCCVDNAGGATEPGGSAGLPINKQKFEKNGCRKVDRDDSCKLKLYRG